MDPLSIAAAIAGLLGATARTSSSLSHFISSVKEAPKLARDLLDEISDVRLCLIQLQSLILEINPDSQHRAALIMIDQIVVTLTSSVIEFSKLEKLLDSLGVVGESMNARRRLRWVKNEQSIRVILNRLQASKTSLNFMLTTFTW